MTKFGEHIAPGLWSVYEGELLARERTEFQQIEVYDHVSFGRTLVLDTLVQTTANDEFMYHEMLVHVPLLMHPSPERVLVIGGGDGGTLRRVLEHPSVQEAVMVEIDRRVIELSREFLPSVGGDAFDDPRANVIVGDGVAYVAESRQMFDAIIVDSSEPIGPGIDLFGPDFYASARRTLARGGVFSAQLGSPFFRQDEVRSGFENVAGAFDSSAVYTACVPAYPGSLWCFAAAGDSLDVDGDVAAERADERGLVTRYWTPDVHRSAFDLPGFVGEIFEQEGGPPLTLGASLTDMPDGITELKVE